MLLPGPPSLRFRRLAQAVLLISAPAPTLAAPPAVELSAPAAHAAIVQVLAAPGAERQPLSSVLMASLAATLGAGAVATAAACLLRGRRPRLPAPRYFPLEPPPAIPRLADAQRYWPLAPAHALGSLYQGLLARLALDYRLHIAPGATEVDVLEQVEGLRLSGLEDYARRLLEQWQQARYAGAMPSEAAWADLCAGWLHLFPDDATP